MNDNTPKPDSTANEEQLARIREGFRRERGYWWPIWEDIIGMDPEFFEQYLNFSSVPWRRGALSPKTKELIAFALAASVTHMYAPGMRIHASQALKYGATMEELIETLELTSILGVHSVTIALPILREVEAQMKASSAENEPGEQS